MSNRTAKEKLIQLYGAECFIEKLHLRHDTKRKYTSKKQMKRMKQLTYHHIRPRSKGGETSVENGAILSAENHQWFHQQAEESQSKMNKKFQEYKKCKVIYDDDIPEVEIHCTIIKPSALSKNQLKEKERRKETKQFERIRKEYEDR